MGIFKKGELTLALPIENPLGYPFPAFTNSPRPLKAWDKVYTQFIKSFATPELLAADKELLVPNHKALNQLDLVAKIFEAIAYAESGFDRCLRFVETGIRDKDLVTKQQNVSEGLLQVSYQDQELYGAKFDWDADRSLSVKNTQRTIFDPYRNLHCGILIFTHLLKRNRGSSLISAGSRYWSTLRPGNGLIRVKKYLAREL